MNQNRIVEIDGLRGLAALAVVLFHYLSHYDALYGHSFTPPELAQYGYFGAHFFFVISGFCILRSAGNIDRPLDFLWPRFTRIYPTYLVALILTFGVVALFSLPGRESGFRDLAFNFFMVQEYFNVQHIDDVYWTLTLELAFYTWVSVFILFNQLKNIEQWLLLWVVIASLLTLDSFNLQMSVAVKSIFLLQYIEFFAIGVCISRLNSGADRKLTHIVLVACLVSIMAAYPAKIACFLIIMFGVFYLAVKKNISLLTVKPVVYLGTISYAFYLVHQNIGYVIINAVYAHGGPGYLGVLVALSTAFIIATVITFLIEKPARKHLATWYLNNDKIQRIADRFTL